MASPSYERELSALDQYVTNLFAPEDEALRWIQAEADRHDLPQISIRAHEGRLLQVLIRAINAIKAVEIGALAGYSGVWIARALPVDGKLFTLEKSSRHAQVARAGYQRAGVDKKVVLREGAALDSLPHLTAHGPFDFVFLDADRTSYLDYLKWVEENLRPGGILAVHNAYAGGRVLKPEGENDQAMIAFNEALAKHPRFDSTIIGVGDALAVAVKKS